jgi:WD40 repeat protein
VAAVKAIAWSPHQHGLLASGGGTADRCIRFWNTLTSQPMQCVDTGMYINQLIYSSTNELLYIFFIVHIKLHEVLKISTNSELISERDLFLKIVGNQIHKSKKAKRNKLITE